MEVKKENIAFILLTLFHTGEKITILLGISCLHLRISRQYFNRVKLNVPYELLVILHSLIHFLLTYHRQGVEHTCSSSWVSWAFAHSRIHGPASDPSRLGASFVINSFREMGG